MRRNSIGERIVAGGVGLQTLALRALSPAERFWRIGPESQHDVEPPLWLRRHAGPLSAFHSSAEQAIDLIDRLQILPERPRVLDFGCGPGALVPGLSSRIGPAGRYLGLDVHAPSIRWCCEAFRADSRFEFAALDSRRASAPWPVIDGQWDFVVAKSVFTHLLESQARFALTEIRRSLSPRGRGLVTAFLIDSGALPGSVVQWFAFVDAKEPRIRLRRRFRPSAAVAYERSLFEMMLQDAGLALEFFVAGFFPGRASPPTGQDVVVVKRA